jgi:hypothetical protein
MYIVVFYYTQEYHKWKGENHILWNKLKIIQHQLCN